MDTLSSLHPAWPAGATGRGGLPWLAGALVCLGLLMGCVRVLPAFHPLPGPRRLEAGFDQAWVGALRSLSERGYPVERAERAEGTLETGWLSVNSEYGATVFVTRHEDRYSDCGKPGATQAYQGKQARIRVRLSRLDPGESEMRVQATFRTHVLSNFLFWAGRPLGEAACHSRGRLEEELAVQIRLRTIGDRLERLRRGVPGTP